VYPGTATCVLVEYVTWILSRFPAKSKMWVSQILPIKTMLSLDNVVLMSPANIRDGQPSPARENSYAVLICWLNWYWGVWLQETHPLWWCLLIDMIEFEEAGGRGASLKTTSLKWAVKQTTSQILWPRINSVINEWMNSLMNKSKESFTRFVFCGTIRKFLKTWY